MFAWLTSWSAASPPIVRSLPVPWIRTDPPISSLYDTEPDTHIHTAHDASTTSELFGASYENCTGTRVQPLSISSNTFPDPVPPACAIIDPYGLSHTSRRPPQE